MSGDGARSGHRSLAVVGVAAAALASGTWALALRDAARLDGTLDVTGPQLAIAFLACEVFALRVERTYGESYGFNLALVPLGFLRREELEVSPEEVTQFGHEGTAP